MKTFNKGAFLAAAAMSVVMASSAWAQDSAGAQEGGEIVITGSRLPSGDLTGSAPLTILDSTEITKTGRTSIGELLRELPVASAAASDSAGRGNDGSANIALRGLSAVNTLVLLNGRRLLSNSAGGTVDLNSIPFDMLERVEVLQDGASAVYGSDAISGVVNNILKREYDGVMLKGGAGVTSRGDLPTQELSGTFGMKGSRGGFIFNASYRNSGGNVIADRPVSRDPNWLALGGHNFRDSAPIASTAFRGIDPTRPTAIMILKEGATDYTNLANYRDALFPGVYTPANLPGDDGINYWEYESSASAIRQTNISLNGHYELVDGVTAFVEAGWSGRHSIGFLAPTYYDGTLTVGADSSTNPFGRNMQVFRTFPEQGIGTNRRNEVDAKLWRVVAGFEGKILGSWSWDTSFNYQRLKQMTNGGLAIVKARLQKAVNDPTIKIIDGVNINDPYYTLGVPCEQTPGCVPINLFGPAGTNITKAQLDAISTERWRDVTATLKSAVVNFAGPLFSLPYGTVNVAIGGEYREETYSQYSDNAPDYDTQSVPFLPPARKISEAYGEIGIPLLKDLPLMKSLDVEAAVRYSHYNSFGSTTNPKVGVKWKPVSDLLVRGSWGTGFRIPNFTEANTSLTRGYRPLNDPCRSDAGPVNLPGCPGVKVPTTTQGAVVTGGNPDLKPESADTLTVGAVFTPSFVPRLSLTVDFFRIKKKGVISTPTIDYLIAQNANGVPGYQDTVVRYGPADPLYGAIYEVYTLRTNLALQQIRGIDVGAQYRFDIGAAGKLDLRADATYTDSHKLSPTPEAAPQELIGTYTADRYTLPRWKATGRATWTLDAFSLTYGTRFVGSVINKSGTINGVNPRTDSYLQHDLAAMYNWDEQQAQITLGVENVTDKMPPFLESNYGNGFDSFTFNSRGRYFYIRVSKGF